MPKLEIVVPKAEIRIGIIPLASWEAEPPVAWETCTSLSIDGTLVNPSRKKVVEDYRRKFLACKEIGEEYRRILDKKGVDPRNYLFINGQRARSKTGDIIKCIPCFTKDYAAFMMAIKGQGKEIGFGSFRRA